MPKTETIRFEDTGDWWEFRTFLTHGLRQDWLPKAFSCLVPPEGETGEYRVDTSKQETISEVNDGLVVASTVAWSYGPVNKETLYKEVPAHHYDQVADRMMDLYIPLVFKRASASPNGSSSPSNETAQSQTN